MIMVRILITFVLSCAIHLSGNSQSVNELVQAAYKLQVDKKHEEAKVEIEKAIKAKGGETNKLAWHVRGFIYKDLFINNRQNELANDFRTQSVQSFLNSIKYDKEKQLLHQNTKALRFLAVSHYNEASDIIDAHQPANISDAASNYSRYREILIALSPDTTILEKDIEYLLAMSTAHRKIYESDRKTYDDYWMESNNFLNEVIKKDSLNFNAFYSLGVSYYNRGAYNLERIPYADILELLDIQSESMKNIEQAYPYMEKAHEIDSTKIQVVRALRIINFNLNKIEESQLFEELERQMQGEEQE